jgi:small-conductance mechanosensitive channel
VASIIFLFIKHPYDIGDAIEIDGVTYTVKEIFLLSTVFVDGRGCDVQCPHNVLNTKYIMNRRRSGSMSETIDFVCGYATTFEQIEDLRSESQLSDDGSLEDWSIDIDGMEYDPL